MYNNGSNKSNKKQSDIKYVTLPYDFIPIPDSYYYPYDENNLPKHNRTEALSGYIEYTLTPKTDLAVEIREGLNDRQFISGSIIKGKTRANAEILSHSYLRFVNHTPMVYRDVAGDIKCKKDKDDKSEQSVYRIRMNLENGIEKAIMAGFLQKEGNEFYVIPAKKLYNGKYFESIKEHDLRNKGMVLKKEYTLYNGQFDKINEYQHKINMLEGEIKKIKTEVKEELKDIKDNISKIFTQDFSFTKTLSKINKQSNDDMEYYNKLKEIKYKILNRLIALKRSDNTLEDLFEKMTERWELKASIDREYYKMNRNKNNNRYALPYQKNISIQRNSNHGIELITTDSNNEDGEKGYLFNSTNASSKRSHYIISEPECGNIGYRVPTDIIAAYKQNHKKFKTTDKFNKELKKDFYDIFDGYEKHIKDYLQGLIVFFDIDSNNEVNKIGRTPYIKIPYKNKLMDIIGNAEYNKIDYAAALFGFTENDSVIDEANKKQTIKAYKSRLRFSPINIDEKYFTYKKQFMLLNPSATAYAMYLKQNGDRLVTYEDDNAKLYGYKYYHVLSEHDTKTTPVVRNNDNSSNIFNTKTVIDSKKNDIELKGKIYFKNITESELGLLLLSINIRELLLSKKYTNQIMKYNTSLNNCYEQIGGAKPYGYGVVEVKDTVIYREKNDNSFASLVIDSKEKIEDKSYYVDAFLEEINNNCKTNEKDYFDYLAYYIQSKEAIIRERNKEEEHAENNPTTITWANLSQEIKRDAQKDGGGYPKEWRLKSRTSK